MTEKRGGFKTTIGAVTGGLLVDRVSATAPLIVGGVVAIAGGALLATVRSKN
jgi:DHA1 family purine ribonucleoside efflux pump-like MFS transporter